MDQTTIQRIIDQAYQEFGNLRNRLEMYEPDSEEYIAIDISMRNLRGKISYYEDQVE